MSNKQSSIDSIIKFCHKQMDNDTSIHKGVYLSIIKFCEQQAKEMHKQEIIDAIDSFYHYNNWSKDLPTKGQQYYKETFVE